MKNLIYNFHRTILNYDGKQYLKIPYSIDNFGSNATNLVKGYKSYINGKLHSDYIEPEDGRTHDLLVGAEKYQVHVDNIGISGWDSSRNTEIKVEFFVIYKQDGRTKISQATLIIVPIEELFMIERVTIGRGDYA